jgi:SHS2 domain-containing protein
MYRWIDHTSELELLVEADTERAVLEEATRALSELLHRDEESANGEAVTHEVTIEADDRAVLLAAWLEELVFLAETEATIPEGVRFEVLDERGLRAHVDSRRGRPPHLVKAVTYHRLSFDPHGDGWRATVVLDV